MKITVVAGEPGFESWASTDIAEDELLNREERELIDLVISPMVFAVRARLQAKKAAMNAVGKSVDAIKASMGIYDAAMGAKSIDAVGK